MVEKRANTILKLPIYWPGYIYIASIFVFSLVYANIPEDFHYSTISKEEVFQTEIADFEDVCSAASHKKLLEEKSIRADRCRIVFASPNKVTLQFFVFGKKTENASFFIISALCDAEFNYNFMSDNNIGARVIEWLKISMDSVGCDNDEFDANLTRKLSENLSWLLGNEDSFRESLASIFNKLQGKSLAKGDRAFLRAFYFSSITITTLGFGDIVPITDRARFIVAIQSILGVVLIGLFLNNLAFVASGKQTESE